MGKKEEGIEVSPFGNHKLKLMSQILCEKQTTFPK